MRDASWNEQPRMHVAAGSLNSESTHKFQCSVLDIVNKQLICMHSVAPWGRW